MYVELDSPLLLPLCVNVSRTPAFQPTSVHHLGEIHCYQFAVPLFFIIYCSSFFFPLPPLCPVVPVVVVRVSTLHASPLSFAPPPRTFRPCNRHSCCIPPTLEPLSPYRIPPPLLNFFFCCFVLTIGFTTVFRLSLPTSPCLRSPLPLPPCTRAPAQQQKRKSSV
jgi:hypothetical protein